MSIDRYYQTNELLNFFNMKNPHIAYSWTITSTHSLSSLGTYEVAQCYFYQNAIQEGLENNSRRNEDRRVNSQKKASCGESYVEILSINETNRMSINTHFISQDATVFSYFPMMLTCLD